MMTVLAILFFLLSASPALSAEGHLSDVASTTDDFERGLEQYSELAIGFDWAKRPSCFFEGREPNRKIYPWEGKAQVPLKPVDFYVKMGRDDLARSWQRRRVPKVTLMVAGLSTMVLAGPIIVPMGTPPACRPGADVPATVESCATTQAVAHLATAGVELVGLGTFLLGRLLPAHPIRAHERRALIYDYNRALAQEMSIPPNEVAWAVYGF